MKETRREYSRLSLPTDSSVIVKAPSVNDDTARVGRSDPREWLAENDIDDLYHMDGSEDQDPANSFSEKDWKLLKLVEMGFPIDEASSAIDRCGGDVSVFVLADSIYAGQITEESGSHEMTSLPVKDLPYFHKGKNRKRVDEKRQYTRRSFQDRKERMKNVLVDDKSIVCRIPKPIIGFGLPNGWPRITQRNIQERAMFLRRPKTRVFFPSSEGKERLSSVQLLVTLGGCSITPYGYSLMLKKLMGFAEGKIVMVLEGGYNLESIANSVLACAKTLLEEKPIVGSQEIQPFELTWDAIQEVTWAYNASIVASTVKIQAQLNQTAAAHPMNQEPFTQTPDPSSRRESNP